MAVNPLVTWPDHTGVEGLSTRAAPALEDAASAARAVEALDAWLAGLGSGASAAGLAGSPQPDRFPYAEVLAHYHAVGRAAASPQVTARLRSLDGLVRHPALDGAPGTWPLREWLPSTVDQETGNYDSYLSAPLLESLAGPGGEPAGESTDAEIDLLLGALAADLGRIEAEALRRAPSQPQLQRTRACLVVLRRLAELAPRWAQRPALPADSAGSHSDAHADSGRVAEVTGELAAEVWRQVPGPCRLAVELALLPTTRLHDEMMFIRTVQIFETLYRQVCRCLARANEAMREMDADRARAELADATARLALSPVLYRVVTTMPRPSFAIIRAYTDGRSAIQSRAYRQIERVCAPRAPSPMEHKLPAIQLAGPTLQESFLALAARTGTPGADRLAAQMRALDSSWRAMKRTHWGITLKIIGKVPGTGGTSGADYLRDMAEIPLFPELERRAADRTMLPDVPDPGGETGVASGDQANASLRRKIMGFIVAQAIHAVTEAGVVDALAAGPRPVAELAVATETDPDALHRFLRTLAGEGLFVEQPAGTFTLTAEGALLRADAPGSLRHFSTLMVGEAYQVWELAGHSLRTGEAAFARRFGKPMFEWLADHPDKAAGFDAAQAGLVELRLLPLLDRDWSGVSTVVDVGGGNGSLLARLLAHHPHLRGTLLDQPHVVEQARGNLARAGVADRCRLAPGDFFAAVPGGADAYVLAQILHDWDDERAGEILARCRAAMPGHARLLVVEQAIAEDGRPHPAKLLDLHMLVLLGGRERTESQWRALLGAAGFTVTAISHHARSSLIEARPA